MEFEVIPAIDLKGGRCVQLQQGDRNAVIFSAGNPASIALEWLNMGASRLHIIDLDAAFRYSDNFTIIRDIIERVNSRAKIQVGGGIRTYESATRLLLLGVDRVIFGTAIFRSPQLIERIVDEFSPDRVMIALDVRHGKVAIDGWREVTDMGLREAAAKAADMGAGSILFTNIDVEGLMRGINITVIEEFISYATLPVIVSGGVTTVEDVIKIAETGACGVVIGSALYTGKIDFRELVNLIYSGYKRRRRQDSNL